MQAADIDVYEAIIQQLRSFMAEVQSDTAMINQAAIDCQDNTDNDENVRNKVDLVITSTQVINNCLSEIEELIRALQAEMAAIMEAGNG